MSHSPVADSATPESVGRFGMWVFLVTDAMSFGALFLAYGVLRARADRWPDAGSRLSLPLAAVATFVLLGSSLTMAIAVDHAARAQPGAARRWLGATVALGLAFLALQGLEYRALTSHGIGFGADQAASTFFVATGWHGLHVLAGVLLVGVLAARGRLAALPTVALFWQFLDAVWILLFTFLYLV